MQSLSLMISSTHFDPSLTLKSVIGGFALSIIGSIFLFTANYALFAVLYSIGVIVSLIGTGFLIGFMKQIRQMFKPVRIAATAILFAAFAMVWVSAFALHSAVSDKGENLD